MKEIRTTDMFAITKPYETKTAAFTVTTNGMIKKDSTAVMGAGIAKTAAALFPSLPRLLANSLKKHGNRTFAYRVADTKNRTATVITMPTKQDWRDPSDLELIKKSCKEMLQIADANGLTEVYLPCPGCSNGKLDWNDVKPAIAAILDDRFTVCVRP